jgi:hypothetical protein
MAKEAITLRLREVGRLSARRGFVAKGVDMSSAAVTMRMRILGGLSDMCLRLVEVGRRSRESGTASTPRVH